MYAEDEVPDMIQRHLLAHTPSLLPSCHWIALLAGSDATVLLTGETGTGKSHLARLIHICSPRRNYGFMAVSCGALAVHLTESEFFGHVQGAFSGACHKKNGKFAAAGKGTLLLDEIDILNLHQQANLSRVLETGEFEPVGSNTTQHCRARVIAASNRDLEAVVEEGSFRRDLYYRLCALTFHLPPLRERVEDIASLARGMTARFSQKLKKELRGISDEALAALEAYPWPGNIRQLENAVQQAVLVSRGPQLRWCDLPPSVQQALSKTPEQASFSQPCRTAALRAASPSLPCIECQ